MASATTTLPRVITGSVVSVVERSDDNKIRYVFELNLDWTDGTSSIIFRGYQNFFDFHCQLLDSFPQDAGSIKGCTRTIPYLPGKQLFRRNNKSLALQRLPKLNDYLIDIIKLPERVITSNAVLSFLRDDWTEEKAKYLLKDKTDTSNNGSELVDSTEAILQVDDGIRVRFINNDRITSCDMTDEVYFNDEIEENDKEKKNGKEDEKQEESKEQNKKLINGRADTPDMDFQDDEDTLIQDIPI